MINVGLAGAGFMGRNHFNQYEKFAGKVKVVAICDPQEDRRTGDWSKVGGNLGDAQGSKRDLKGAKPYARFEDMLADPAVQMVDLCVPTYLHKDFSIAALKAGKHVLCEKPMGRNVAECEEMLAAAAKAPGKFMIAQCIRFWPEYVYLKELIDSKRYGALKAINLRRQASTPTYTLENWILDPANSGGAILDLHVHDVDYAIQILGKPRSVTAQSYANPRGSYDRVHALWEVESGVVAQLEGYWDMPDGFGFNCGLTAVFEKAALTWDLNVGKPLTLLENGKAPQTPKVLPNDGYHHEIEYFLDCVAAGKTPTVSTPQASRDAVAVALAEQRSAAERRPIVPE